MHPTYSLAALSVFLVRTIRRRLVGDVNVVRSAAMNCGAARNAQIVARVIAEDVEIRANGEYFTILSHP
jgi:hypothetical protein